MYYQVPRESKDGLAKFSVSDRGERIGPCTILNVAYQPSLGLTVQLSDNYWLSIPASACKASWRF